MVALSCFVRAQNPLAGMTTMKGDGVGTSTCAAAGCAGTGTLRGDPMGQADFQFTFIADLGFPDNCGFGRGNLTITSADGSTITAAINGSGCNTQPTPASSAIQNLAYEIQSGTGRFAGVNGTGNFVIDRITPNGVPGPTYVHLDGNIVFTH